MGLEAYFVFGAVSNYYGYWVLGIGWNIYLAIASTVLTAILAAFLVGLLLSYLDKRKFVKSFQK